MAAFNPNPLLPNIPFSADLGEVLPSATNSPLVLLPVRLETRFFPGVDGVELRVRIYPDKVQLDTHEPELTAQEITWGKHFWEHTWRAAKKDEQATKTAFVDLAQRFGAQRAAWIAKVLSPSNPNDRPSDPVAADKALPKPPKFPDVAKKAEAWTKPPVTRVMPKCWHVLGYAAGGLVVHAKGKPVADVLNVGPDPAAKGSIDPDLPIDPGMKWMIDFDEAEKVGMGVRVRLTQDQAARGFDVLLALGTRGSSASTDQTKELVALFEGHRYTDGLGFVLQGTPSNNTADAPSGFTTNDPTNEGVYAAERAQPTSKAGDGSNADALASALGFTGDLLGTFSRIVNSSAKEPSDALHMNRALWPATCGYFLEQMMTGTPLTPQGRSWARSFFIDHVRAAGPLPAVRVGKQPYGVLPVTSLNQWKAKAGQEAEAAPDEALRDVLLRLRNQWGKNLAEVPRVGGSGNPNQDFTDVLSMDGVSSSYAIRHLMGGVYLSWLWTQMTNVSYSLFMRKQQELTKVGLNALGVSWEPRLTTAAYSGDFAVLGGPVVQPKVASEQAALEPNYITALLNAASAQALRDESVIGNTPRSVLYALLRASLLLEYRTAATNLLEHEPGTPMLTELPAAAFRHDLDALDSSSFPTLWALLARSATALGAPTYWDYLSRLRTAPTDAALKSAVAGLLELRASYEYLKDVKAAKLQRLCAGTLDLSSHRLDAWITAFATKRLSQMRQAAPSGLVIGGYGWVMNLKPGAARVTDRLLAGGQEYLKPADNPGFSMAPSMAQAATVAVLRSGHLSNSSEIDHGVLALDLSSERVRLAEWLLDGVRQGQPLGALIGYRFERRLQEVGLAQFIATFRDLAPLVAKKLGTTLDANAEQAAEAVAASNVVDGLILQKKWKATVGNGDPVAALLRFVALSKKPVAPEKVRQAQGPLILALQLVDDAVDAVSDALIAESVHQAVQGRPQRAASTLDAIASGAAAPPELNVMRTPRTGAALTERVVVLFGGAATVATEWGTPSVAVRANAEPQLNAFASRLLGNPTKVRVLVERLDAKGAVSATKELKLSELKLAPLDLVYAAEGSRDAQPSELEHRILYAITRKSGGFEENTTLRINPARGSDWPITDVSYAEFLELLRAARKLMTGSRPIDGSDLAPPEQNQAPAVDLTELQTRADGAEQALRLLQTDLAKRSSEAASTPEQLREVIVRASSFGVVGAIPHSKTGDSKAAKQALVGQAQSALREIEARSLRLDAAKTAFKPDTANAAQKQAFHTERLQTVFGSAFVVLPIFVPTNATELGKALADNKKVQDNDSLNAVTWFLRHSRVREGLGRLDTVLRYAEALECGERMRLRVAQLPYRQNDRWVGLPLGKGQTLSASRFSLVVHSGAVEIKEPLAGLLVDEWITVVPNATETAGVVFQYDQPDAAPPQSILLAVPPDPNKPWDVWALQQVLLETLDLARLRAVDPGSLDEVGHYLPGLYLAFNPSGETISTDFSPLK